MNKVFKNVLGAMGFSTEDEENFNEEYETPKPRVERTAKASEASSFSETKLGCLPKAKDVYKLLLRYLFFIVFNNVFFPTPKI